MEMRELLEGLNRINVFMEHDDVLNARVSLRRLISRLESAGKVMP